MGAAGWRPRSHRWPLGKVTPLAPPPLRRPGKVVLLESPENDDAPLVIDMEEAVCGVDGWLVLGHLPLPN